MVERFIAPALKTGDLRGSVGSNPATSAKLGKLPERSIGVASKTTDLKGSAGSNPVFSALKIKRVGPQILF